MTLTLDPNGSWPDDVTKSADELARSYVEWLIPTPVEFGQAEHVLAQTIARAIMAERERCALLCEQQAKVFLSPEYSFNQPIGSLTERFACEECAKAIRGKP